MKKMVHLIMRASTKYFANGVRICWVFYLQRICTVKLVQEYWRSHFKINSVFTILWLKNDVFTWFVGRSITDHTPNLMMYLFLFISVYFLAGLKQLQLRSCGATRLESELVSSFASIDCYKRISIPLHDVLWINYHIKWFIQQLLCRLP